METVNIDRAKTKKIEWGGDRTNSWWNERIVVFCC